MNFNKRNHGKIFIFIKIYNIFLILNHFLSKFRFTNNNNNYIYNNNNNNIYNNNNNQ